MIRARRPWNTASIRLDETGVYYCLYCREAVEEFTEIDHRDVYTYRNCTCEKADIQMAQDQYRKPPAPESDMEFLKEVRYKNAIYRVNREFGK